jgi:deoxyxylulose-5-phosphate synthase
VTVEDGVAAGGVGMTLAATVAQRCPGLPVAVIAAGDHPVVQGSVSRIHEREGMDPGSIASTCRGLADRRSHYPESDS